MAKGVPYRRLMRDFALWCTLSCLQKIATSTRWMAVAFTVVFIAMLAAFCGISINLTCNYFKSPSSTELSINVNSTSFPRIALCNENPMKRSMIDTNGPYSEIAKLLNQYELIEQSKESADDFRLRTTKSRLQRQRRARVMLRLLMAQLTDADRYAAGYAFPELVTECTFAGRTCTSSDFTPFLHPDYNVCYAFNGERMIAKAGKVEGLRMLMTVNQDVNGKFEYLWTTDAAAVRAVIYDMGEYPDFDKGGIRVGVGLQSFVALSKTTHNRLEKPYGACTHDNSSTAERYPSYPYTFQLCQHSCLQRLASERCGCADPLYAKAANETYCTTAANMLCLITLTHDVADARDKKGNSMCGCLQPCELIVYHKSVSNSNFPSGNYLVAAGTQGQRGVLLASQGGGRRGAGDDSSDDYEHSSTSTSARPSQTTSPATTTTAGRSTTTTSQTTTTSTAPSTTTTEKNCKYPGPPASGESETSSSKHCETDPMWKKVYNDPGVVAIRGFPCISTAACNTCVFFADDPPPSLEEFPCDYTYGPACSSKSNKGHFHVDCPSFLTNFSFIPHGTNLPNIPNWHSGALPNPGDPTTCQSISSSSDLSKLQTSNAPLDPPFMKKLTPSTTMCELVELAISSAEAHYGSKHDGGKRKRRDTAASDMPGVGSCEHANRNFKGATECIEWYKRNGLVITVFFETLEMHTYTQGATYDLVALLTDISGHAGLWLGMSVISVVELIGLIFLCLDNFFCGANIRIADEEEIKREVDKRERRSRRLDSRYTDPWDSQQTDELDESPRMQDMDSP